MNSAIETATTAVALSFIFGFFYLIVAGIKRWRYGYQGDRPSDPKIARRFNAALERFEKENPDFAPFREQALRAMSKDMRIIESRIITGEVQPYEIIRIYADRVAS